MPFPLSIRGSIPIPDTAANVSDDAIIVACVDQIEHEGARVVSRGDHSMAFTVPFISWGSNWRFTVPLSAGSLEITHESGRNRRLRYDLSTRRTAVLGTLMCVGLFAFGATSRSGQMPWWVPLLAWLWLVGSNYGISYVRTASWASRRVSDAVKASGR